MQTIKSIVEDSDTRLGRLFDVGIQILIVLSIISFSFETLPTLDPAVRRFLETFEVVAVAIFTAEYLLRLIVADKKLSFVSASLALLMFWRSSRFTWHSGLT